MGEVTTDDRSIEVIGLLTSAAHNWTRVQGLYRYWRDVSGANAAFAASAQAQSLTRAFSSNRTTDIVEETIRFAIAGRGRVVHAEALVQVGLPTRPNVVHVNGPTTTARFGQQWITNEEDASISIGGTEFVELLRPTHVAEDFRLTVFDDCTDVAGRPAIVALAEFTGAKESIGPPEAFAMVAGGSQFRLWIDEVLGILLRVAKLQGGRPVEISEFLELDVT